MPNILLPVPHRQQRNDGDCLAACAAMVLEHLSVPGSYDRLLELLDVKPYGTPGSHLNRLIDLGVHVRYTQGSLDELLSNLDRGNPSITLVRTDQLPYWPYATDHAVVVIGYEGQEILINDPAFETAPRRVSCTEFELAWLEFDYRYATIWR